MASRVKEDMAERVLRIRGEDAMIQEENVTEGGDDEGCEVYLGEVGNVIDPRRRFFLSYLLSGSDRAGVEFREEPEEEVDEPRTWLPQGDHSLSSPHIWGRIRQEHQCCGDEIADDQGWQ